MEESTFYHAMTIGGPLERKDRIGKLARLSSIMNQSAQVVSTIPLSGSGAEFETAKQIITTCLTVSELSKQEIARQLRASAVP
jgi:hypothetical protein